VGLQVGVEPITELLGDRFASRAKGGIGKDRHRQEIAYGVLE